MAEENSIIKINNSTYSVEDKWFEVAKKYFELNKSENELEISFLKAGLFGYNNEIMANEIKNAVYHRNVLYDEHFLNTASIPQSIYNFAKVQNHLIANAKPASMRAILAISKEDIVESSEFKKVEISKNLTDSDSTYQYIMPEDTSIIMGGYNFRLPYPVKFIFKSTKANSEFTVSASYDISGEEVYAYHSLGNPYLKLWEDSYNGERYIFVTVDLYQIQKSSVSTTINSQDLSENLYFTFNYSNQLVDFNVYYEYENERFLLNKYFNNTITPKENEKFCFYSYTNNGKIEISFSSILNSFRPKYNSVITVEAITTSGSKGNFSYGGRAMISLKSENKLETINVSLKPLTDGSGGSDAPTLKEIKQELVDNYLIRNNIITDKDVESLFNNVSIRSRVNNGFIKFIKKRNDIIKRVWSTFLLLKNYQGSVIPTRTINAIEVDNEILKENNYTLPENTAIVYDLESNTYKVLHHKLEVMDYTDSSKFLVYSLPYLMKIDVDPLLNVKYYKTFTNQNYGINYKYINGNVDFQFLASDVSIYRDTMEADNYNIELNLTSNYSKTDLKNNIKIRGVLKSKTGKVYGYFNFKNENTANLLFTANLSTDLKNVINNGKLNIYNSLFNLEDTDILDNNGNTTVINTNIDQEVLLDIYILVKGEEDNTKYGDAIKMKDIDEYSTICSFTTDTPIKLFNDLNSMMDSTVYADNENDKLIIKSIPVVEYVYYGVNYKEFYDTVDVYFDIIKQSLNKLENNTDIDLKFFNTHGESLIYYDGNSNNGLTSRIDVDIDLNVYTNFGVSNELDMQLKEFISNFIESCNEEGLFPVSTLFRRIEETFEFVRYIEFNSINNNIVQKIEMKDIDVSTATKEDIQNFVPEYLNLRKKQTLAYDSKEEKAISKYDYSVTINYI